MLYYAKNSVSIFILLGFFMVSCQPKETKTRADLRAEKLESRLKVYVANKRKICKDDLYERATIIADSLMRVQAISYQEDSIARPALPTKPTVLIKKLRPEELPLKPPVLDSTRLLNN